MLYSDTFRLRAERLTAELTLDEKLLLLSTHHSPVPRLGLEEFFIGHEVARGFVGRDDDHFSTVFPQPIGLASAFDRELMKKLGDICGTECRAYYNRDKKGCTCVWGPTVDMERDPRWGRTEEAYGEDVFLAGELTAAYTKAMAGDNGTYLKTVPTLKHFCANNNEKHRGSCDAYLPLRLKYEYYYAAFMNAIRFGGAKSVMTAYNEINGVPALCDPELNTVLKDKWGLWFAVTDGGDFSQTVTAHRYSASHAEVLAESMKAGCDTMTDSDILVKNAAQKALDEGLLTKEDIDRTVANVLYARLKLGHTAADCPYDSISMADVDTQQSQQVNLRAAMEQVVLLKNDGTLPLRPTGRIGVLGPIADENLRDWYTGVFREAVSVKNGVAAEFPECETVHDSLWDIIAVKAPNGKYLSVREDGSVTADAETITETEMFELQDWGENWQNLFSVKFRRYLRNTDGTLKLHNRTIYDWFTHETFNIFHDGDNVLIEEFLGHQRLTCGKNGSLAFVSQRSVLPDECFSFELISSGRDRAAKLAVECDTLIYCTGNYPVQVAKECLDRKTLRLNIQEGMALYLHSLNPRTVLALISSYPYSICDEQDVLPAILWSSHAGPHLGTAVAAALSGRNVPAGRLPMTWYRSENELPDIMDYDIESAGTTYMYFRGTPLYPFGFGLSYAEFEYSNLALSSSPHGSITAELDVKNTSDVDADEVVQLYFTVTDSAVSRPLKKLCGFERVHIAAGEKKHIRISVPEHILQIYDLRSGNMLLEGGTYRFMAGASSADIRLTGDINVEGEGLSLRSDRFEAQSCDSSSGTVIKYARNILQHYVTVRGWDGCITFGGVRFAGKSAVKLRVSSVSGERTLNVEIGSCKLETVIAASDGYCDFAEYTLQLPGDLPDISEMKVLMPEGVSILDIELL